MDGDTKRALARATRIRHPPDMSLVFLWMVDPPSESLAVDLKPNPTRMVEARDSNVEGSSSSWRSYKSNKSSLSGPDRLNKLY